MKTVNELQEELNNIQEQIDTFELDPEDYEEIYREALNEQGEITIGYLTFDPADVLENCDPIAYRVGLNDYASNIDLEDSKAYQELLDRKEEITDEINNHYEEEKKS